MQLPSHYRYSFQYIQIHLSTPYRYILQPATLHITLSVHLIPTDTN